MRLRRAMAVGALRTVSGSAIRTAVVALVVACLLSACAAPTALSPPDDRAYEVSGAWIGGRPAVAWYGGRLQHEAIFLQYADLRGRPVGDRVQLTDATRDAYEPSLQDLQGDALVAWYEQESAPRGAPRRQWAFVARFDSRGSRLWQRQLSAEDASGRIPVVRVAGGIIHAAWLEQRGDAMPTLRVASLDAAGEWLHAPRDAAAVGRNTWNLNAAVSADGTFHVLLDAEPGSRAKELHWVQVRDDRIEDRRVSQDDGHESAYPDIAFEGSRYAVTWFDSRDGNEEVYLRCGELDSSGAPPADLMLDDAGAVHEAGARRVTHTSTESIGAYLTWHEGRIELAWTEGMGTHRVLWRQRFDRDCRPLGAARSVDGQGTEAGIPSLAASSAGLLLAWNGQRGDPSAPAHGHSRRPSSAVLLQVSPNAAAR